MTVWIKIATIVIDILIYYLESIFKFNRRIVERVQWDLIFGLLRANIQNKIQYC